MGAFADVRGGGHQHQSARHKQDEPTRAEQARMINGKRTQEEGRSAARWVRACYTLVCSVIYVYSYKIKAC